MLEYVENTLPPTIEEYEEEVDKRLAIERALQLAIEICIDVSNQIVKESRLGISGNDEGTLKKLRIAKIISPKLFTQLNEMKKFRNVLVHHYTEIDDQKVFHHATHDLDDFRLFQKEILTYLKRPKTPPRTNKLKNKPKK